MIIDAHNHPDWWYKNIDDEVADMDACNIDKAFIFSWECPEDEYDPDQRNVLDNIGEGVYPIAFEKCLRYKKLRPDRFILGFAPDPRSPSAIDRLESAVALHRVRVCGEVKLRMMYDSPDAIDMFRWCGKNGLPVTLHFDYPVPTGHKYPRRNWWYGGDMDTLENVLKKCPDTNFLGHAPGFWANISADNKGLSEVYPTGRVVPGGKLQQLLRHYPNLYCDISAGSGRNAFERDREYAKEFIDEFQDRIVYARDHFDNRHQQLLESLGLSAEVLGKIYCGNVSGLLHGDVS